MRFQSRRDIQRFQENGQILIRSSPNRQKRSCEIDFQPSRICHQCIGHKEYFPVRFSGPIRDVYPSPRLTLGRQPKRLPASVTRVTLPSA